MVHQNAFWTAAPVMRAATLFEMQYGYCNRTHLSIIKKTHAKSSNCTVTVWLTLSLQLQANTTLCTLGLEQHQDNSYETLLLIFVFLAFAGQQFGFCRSVPSRMCPWSGSVQSEIKCPLTKAEIRVGLQQCNTSFFLQSCLLMFSLHLIEGQDKWTR